MSLIRGTKSLLALMGDRVQHGSLGTLFRRGKSTFLTMHPELLPGNAAAAVDQTPPALQDLQMRLDETVRDEQALKIYTAAVSELRASYRLLETNTRLEITDVFVWVWQVADEFLSLLEVPTQEAVVIFVHFCVLFQRVENKWWLHNWADQSLSQAYKYLDYTHRLWIRWPIEQLGWIQP